MRRLLRKEIIMGNCIGKLCRHLVLSQAVTFADGVLQINIPAGSYNNGERYCLVIAQAIPTETTIAAPVVITIGAGTEQYPLQNRCCAPVTACGIRTRMRYATVVATSPTGGVFKLLGAPACAPDYSLTAIDGTAPATTPAEGGA